MKHIFTAALAAALLLSCQSTPPSPSAPGAPRGTAIAATPSPSYAFGLVIGNNLKSTGVALDYAAFSQGVRDGMENRTGVMSLDEANAMAQQAIADSTAKAGAANKEKEAAFLAENGKKPGIMSTASGLQYQVITEGDGQRPTASDVVKVDYVGSLTDGTVFDSSIARGEPMVLPLEGVIPGWTEGLQLMKVGSKYILYIPSALAYGETGAGGVIPPNATIVFEVTLLGIEDASALDGFSGE